MSEQPQDLITHIDVQPDLEGLQAFNKEIDRAIQRVNKLDKAIKRTNELRPRSRYAPPVNNPAASAAAAEVGNGLGSNLVSRTPLADQVKRAQQQLPQPSPPLRPPAPHGSQPASPLKLPATTGRALSQAKAAASPGASGQLSTETVVSRILREVDLGGLNWNESDVPGEKKKKRNDADDGGDDNDKSGGFDAGSMLAGAATALGLATALDAVAESLDKIQQQEAQLDRLPQTINGAKQSFLELNAAASDLRVDSGAFISTYTNMATATEKLHLTQEELIQSSQGLVGALQLGGGSKDAVSNALYQMGQAFSSDRFGGDEFKSFMEAIGTQAPEVARAFDTDVKGLRKMSEEGKLTAEVVVKAFQKMATNNIAMLNKQGWTWGQVVTVMGNDWESFLATATSGGEWAKLTGWIASNVIPVVRKAEKAVSDFWTSVTDESKSNILLGILAAIGAGFVALAIPVLAATWPFLAIGAAVWLALEIFNDFKSWMDGKGGNIFDSLFGSFDEFERRYPNILKALRALMDFQDKYNLKKQLAPLRDNAPDYIKKQAEINDSQPSAVSGVVSSLSDALNWFIGDIASIPKQLKDLPMWPPALTKSGAPNTAKTTISNSGNTTIEVKSPEEAVKVADSQRGKFLEGVNNSGNMAEGYGAI